MSDYQFPPSSPVLNAADSDFDPFARPKDSVRGRCEYPTPNPSSTAGRSSSPARHENDLADEEANAISPVKMPFSGKFRQPVNVPLATRERRPTVSINRDFNILNPDASVMRIPLVSGQSQLLVGRSSKSCDFHMKTSDKTISRAHVQISYDTESLTITCLGYNGLGMIVPRVCQVSETGEKAYELRETGKPLQATNLSKTIHLDYQHTEFHVNRGEKVRMPRFSNVLLQIRDLVLLVNPDDYDEEVTDDEEIELVKPVQTLPPPLQAILEHQPPAVAKPQQEYVPQTPQMASKETPMAAPTAAPTAIALASPMKKKTAFTTTSVLTPTNASAETPKTPRKPLVHISAMDESTPSKARKEPIVIFQDAQEPKVQPPKRSMTPLSNKSTNLLHTPPAKRRAASEEPSGKRVKHEPKQELEKKVEPMRDAEGKLIIDGKCIQNISNLSEIENILINHLAFSRLSSTPASFLNTILAAVSKLSLEQLRSVLHAVECIGVIYRQGKDAAGKPLEEEYYYVPEKDHDPERNKLVSLIKGHGGLRACRRTHKQYYWKKPAPIKK
ncbi:CIC11C00000005783 [Sungouiella intermedia]|uniref:CIC11C00000005783 n=1 Tax=Sungouiella intermedia TaxID=45354 RepID=A0A1L0BSE4_9ASCO|nr:CIC11C00000005783 [[Candida] intermedia]